jgi:5-methylcytosine-specific restriction enzyme subunit McrC
MVVSRSSIRQIDPRIGGVLLGAYDYLRRQISHVAEPRHWLTDRGYELIKELQCSINRREVDEACRSRSPIRYSPINESYRPAVDLSLTILGRHPFMSSAEGNKEVYGALLDMAEIWELYLFHLIRDELSDAEVIHAGRSPEAVFWLLTGKGEDRIGAMKPDILLSSRDGARRIILDAKYKSTAPSPSRPQGVLREDLYQMAAYLSIEAAPPGTLDGGLVYPSSPAIWSLESRSPFRVQRSNARFFFFGLNCFDSSNPIGLTPAEIRFVSGLRSHLQP